MNRPVLSSLRGVAIGCGRGRFSGRFDCRKTRSRRTARALLQAVANKRVSNEPVGLSARTVQCVAKRLNGAVLVARLDAFRRFATWFRSSIRVHCASQDE